MGITTTTALIIMGISAAASAASAIAQGEAEARAAEFNASIAEQQAAREQEIAARDAAEFGRNADRVMSSQRALFAGSGLEVTGSALGVVTDTAGEAAFEELNILAGGDARAAGLRLQAKLSKQRGKNARTAGFLNAGTSVLGAASQAAGSGFFGKPASVTPTTGSFRFGGAGGQRQGGGF